MGTQYFPESRMHQVCRRVIGPQQFPLCSIDIYCDRIRSLYKTALNSSDMQMLISTYLCISNIK